ncbi:MAG TPA: nuclear transport factor 2 family protein, partial [Terriglobia bacterium]|nr:nuclear transport factor 2 family protein [Terriglobia bacterium]
SDSQAAKCADQFKFSRSIQVELHPTESMRVSGDSATVPCRFLLRIVTVDGKKANVETNTTFTLRKTGGAWVIESMH